MQLFSFPIGLFLSSKLSLKVFIKVLFSQNKIFFLGFSTKIKVNHRSFLHTSIYIINFCFASTRGHQMYHKFAIQTAPQQRVKSECGYIAAHISKGSYLLCFVCVCLHQFGYMYACVHMS